MSAAPYRSLAIVDERRPARVEAANCDWCRFRLRLSFFIYDGDRDMCSHPCEQASRILMPLGFKERKTAPHACRIINPRGECPHWEPSWRTRWARRLRLGRAPAMVDPRVWDKDAMVRS